MVRCSFYPLIDTSEIVIGPNAILSLTKEKYNGEIDINQILASIKSKGLRNLMLKHWKYGLNEMIKNQFPIFVKTITKLYTRFNL